ncbi:hypothetical protein BKA70DRAFT_1275872 [Coprinopsis sp. MPI-PUGE-AT-0042]|nr:hypothetical protein BKA70DRAFT_1275872 [Coprinopsis sp. MPI-PUGE-AT-0042]
MGQHFEFIPAKLIPFIERQKIFWVATAPLAEDGHVNVSPKGCFEKTMNVILDEEDQGEKKNSRAVWYEDLSGSGNGRITVMFTAFDGAPNIIRLYGTGKVFELGTPEYNGLLPPEKRQPGSRAIIWVDVHKVGTSCGFSIPFFEYKAPRTKLHKLAVTVEQEDVACAAELKASAISGTPVTRETVDVEDGKRLALKGIRNFWRFYNMKSLDGLPGLESAYDAEELVGKHATTGEVFSAMSQKEPEEDGQVLDQATGAGAGKSAGAGAQERNVVDTALTLGIGFMLGALFMRYANK